MKNICGIILLIYFLLCSTNRAQGQSTDYYTGNRMVVYDKVYIINHPQDYRKGDIEIWDSTNVKMFTPQFYPNGEEIPLRHRHFNRLYYQDREKIKEAVRAVFSPEEIRKFKEKNATLSVELVVDSTGNIIEQKFHMSTLSLILRSIPPEKLYHLEKQLKEKVRFNVEEYEKQFGFTKGKVINISFINY